MASRRVARTCPRICGRRWPTAVLADCALFVSDDATPISPDAAEHVLDQAATVVELEPNEPVTDAADPMLRTALASFDPVQLRHLDAIRAVGAKKKGNPSPVLTASELTGPLRLGDAVTRFEVANGMRSVSANGAPRVFSS